MISTAVGDHIKTALGSLGNWASTFSEPARATIARPEIRREIGRLTFIDSYHRIRQTTPLILAAVQALDARFDHDNARFWAHHLEEEYGHDAVMRRDIVAMLGDERRATEALREASITPPSVALIGFFEWQVRHNNPHLLIFLRLFLERLTTELGDTQVAAVHDLIPGGSEVVRLHREEDHGHAAECSDYADRNFRSEDLATAVWVVDFIALCLNEAQSWVAAHVLGRAAR